MAYDLAPRQRPETGHGQRVESDGSEHDPLVIDCDTCAVRGLGCDDCVVTVLLGGPPAEVTLNDEERRAVNVLAAAGLVPPLRLVRGLAGGDVDPP